jgi:hypothetical protein
VVMQPARPRTRSTDCMPLVFDRAAASINASGPSTSRERHEQATREEKQGFASSSSELAFNRRPDCAAETAGPSPGMNHVEDLKVGDLVLYGAAATAPWLLF